MDDLQILGRVRGVRGAALHQLRRVGRGRADGDLSLASGEVAVALAVGRTVELVGEPADDQGPLPGDLPRRGRRGSRENQPGQPEDLHPVEPLGHRLRLGAGDHRRAVGHLHHRPVRRHHCLHRDLLLLGDDGRLAEQDRDAVQRPALLGARGGGHPVLGEVGPVERHPRDLLAAEQRHAELVRVLHRLLDGREVEGVIRLPRPVALHGEAGGGDLSGEELVAAVALVLDHEREQPAAGPGVVDALLVVAPLGGAVAHHRLEDEVSHRADLGAPGDRLEVGEVPADLLVHQVEAEVLATRGARSPEHVGQRGTHHAPFGRRRVGQRRERTRHEEGREEKRNRDLPH